MHEWKILDLSFFYFLFKNLKLLRKNILLLYKNTYYTCVYREVYNILLYIIRIVHDQITAHTK